MYHYFKKWIKKFFLFAGIFSFFVNVFNLTFPIYMLAIYDKVLKSFSIPTLLTLTLGATLAIIVMAVLDVLRSRILVLAGVEIQKTLSQNIIEQSIYKFATTNESTYKEGIRDLHVLRQFLGGNAIFFLFDLPWMPIYLFVIYCIHPYLAILAIGGALLAFILGYFQAKLTSNRMEICRAMEDYLNTFQNSLFLNAELITAMHLFPAIKKRWQKNNDHLLTLVDKYASILGLFSSLSRSFRTLIPVLVYGLGAYLVIRSEVTVGAIIAASILTRQFMSPIDSMISSWKQTIEAKGAYKRLDTFLKEDLEDHKSSLPAPKGIVEVKGLGYQVNNRYLLKNINFSLYPGEIIALIGPSGAGKSTLCRLLLGIYEPTEGEIQIDGANLKQWNKEQLGPYLGYLPQDVQLFKGTVAENIARMQENIESERIIQAATQAKVHQLVLSLPKGYDTDIGERGMFLSGGQRQRIALARAFFGEPKIIILDEPNSNLDDVGEKNLILALQEMKNKKRSILVVSHRPSILSIADKVLILQAGQIKAFGPTKEVLANLMGKSTESSPKKQTDLTQPQIIKKVTI